MVAFIQQTKKLSDNHNSKEDVFVSDTAVADVLKYIKVKMFYE